MCEATLATKFITGRKVLVKEQGNKFEVLNRNSLQTKLHIDLIDFH